MDNRQNLLDCALELFSRRGYDAVGVQEVVEAAGVTKPTLYHYFGSKQGLLRALLEQHFQELDGCICQACEYHGDLPLTLRRVARAWFGFARSQPVFYRLALALLFTPAQGEAYPIAAAPQQELHDHVEALFAAAVQNHGNMRGRQRLYAASFIGLVNTSIFLWLNGHLELDDRLVEAAVHQFEHGIYS